MSPQRSRPPRTPAGQDLNDPAIDAMYGLEPVFEPEHHAGDNGSTDEAAPFVTVQCPYCGEPFETRLDLSAGSNAAIEDCQICCRPIELRVTVDEAGALLGFDARRSD